MVPTDGVAEHKVIGSSEVLVPQTRSSAAMI